MAVNKNTEQDEYQPDMSTTYQMVSDSGDRLVVSIDRTGLSVIRVEILDENTILGSMVVSGLTPQQAMNKPNGFWGRLWDKIKGVVRDVIDAVTFEAGPLTCRPTANVSFHDDKVASLTVGISCKD